MPYIILAPGAVEAGARELLVSEHAAQRARGVQGQHGPGAAAVVGGVQLALALH